MIKLPVMMLSMASANADEPQLLRRRLNADNLMVDAEVDAEAEVDAKAEAEAEAEHINPAICDLPKDKGQPGATKETKRWFFDQYGRCDSMSYKGSGGNANNFETRKECKATCQSELKHVKAIWKKAEENFFLCIVEECEYKQKKHVASKLHLLTERMSKNPFKHGQENQQIISSTLANLKQHDFKTCYADKTAAYKAFPKKTDKLNENKNRAIKMKMEKEVEKFFKCEDKTCRQKHQDQYLQILQKEANIDTNSIIKDNTTPAFVTSKKAPARSLFSHAVLFLCKMNIVANSPADAEPLEEPINPAICDLPKDKGQPGATKETKRWFFDQYGECHSMSYKGSGGNANNFETRKECQETCEPEFKHGKALWKRVQEDFFLCSEKECESNKKKVVTSKLHKLTEWMSENQNPFKYAQEVQQILSSTLANMEQHDFGTCYADKKAAYKAFPKKTKKMNKSKSMAIKKKMEKEVEKFVKCENQLCRQKHQDQYLQILQKEANIDTNSLIKDNTTPAFVTSKKAPARSLFSHAVLYLCKMNIVANSL